MSEGAEVTLDTAVLADLAARIDDALTSSAYFSMTPAEAAALLAEVESLRAVRDAAAALLEADAAPGPEGADLSTNEVERAWIAWDVRRSAAVRALRAALVSEEGSRPVTERQVSVGGDNE